MPVPRRGVPETSTWWDYWYVRVGTIAGGLAILAAVIAGGKWAFGNKTAARAATDATTSTVVQQNTSSPTLSTTAQTPAPATTAKSKPLGATTTTVVTENNPTVFESNGADFFQGSLHVLLGSSNGYAGDPFDHMTIVELGDDGCTFRPANSGQYDYTSAKYTYALIANVQAGDGSAEITVARWPRRGDLAKCVRK